LARANLTRTQDLAQKNFVSSSAYDTAESNVAVAQAKLALAQARLAKTQIVAPFAGTLGIRSVSLGDYVKEGSDLVNLEETRVLKADFRLPERALTQLRVGQAVQLAPDALPDQRFRGAIVAIDPRIDANGRAIIVSAQVDNRAARLRPGMFVRIGVVVATRPQALLLPEQALVPSGDEIWVFKVVDGKALRTPVQVGVRRAGEVEILRGLTQGESVVVSGQQRLTRDGQAVRVVAASPVSAP
jgi:membrane fusion protein (multidrug efflux system)